ncbi:MAG: efflux RND transporter periplasmic adaptor subunit, partial [Lachnospiraceae bacterium]|nr:efflux RND transporter periplasmic adaptor subunit [Lachnospiraceae bacterium]
QNLQAQVNQSNYDASSKQLEIDRQQAAMENNKVVSPMDGTVKEINESVADATGVEGDMSSNMGSNNNSTTEKAYITIMATGDLRVKGTASEMNVRSMSNGQSVIVHSRLDETLIWKGTIKSIDLEHTENNNNEIMYGGGGETTSNYPFYIELENTDGLILGEHVYIEMDYGQTETKSGVWLDEFFVVQDAGGAYVWAENSKGRIEKREVQLGEYDSELMKYEILAGITTDDYIAFPEDRFKEGMKTTHSYDELLKYEEEMGGSDEMGVDDPEAGLDPDAIGVDEPEAVEEPDASGVDEPEAVEEPDASGVNEPEAGVDSDTVESPDEGELPSGEEAE